MAGCTHRRGVAAFQSFQVAPEVSMLSGVGWLQVVRGICIHNSHKPIFYLIFPVSILFQIHTKHIYGTSRNESQRQFYELLPSALHETYGQWNWKSRGQFLTLSKVPQMTRILNTYPAYYVFSSVLPWSDSHRALLSQPEEEQSLIHV